METTGCPSSLLIVPVAGLPLIDAAPTALLRYIAKKGSICVDGVSLTVNEVDGEGFEVALIPHTVAHTAFAQAQVGDAVNLEIDLVARYVERLLGQRSEEARP